MSDVLPDAATLRSPYHEHLGFTLLEWRENLARLALDLQPFHLNRNGIAHGGVILSLVDETGGATGNWCSVPGHVRLSVTVGLTVSFVGRAAAGRLIATGRIASQGRSLFFVRTEVHGADGALVAFGTSTHRRRRGSETLEGVAAAAAGDQPVLLTPG